MKFVFRRVLAAVPTLLVVALTVFAMRLIIPGGTAAALAGENASPETLARINHQLGLDRPLPVQFLTWLWHAVRGDLGVSTSSHDPVTKILLERMPATIELVGGTALLSLLIGSGLGVWAAIRRRQADGKTVFAIAGAVLSLPDFWLAILGAGLFGLTLGLVPAVGYSPVSEGLGSNIRSVGLPVLILSLHSSALICRQVRSSLSRELETVHVRTAWGLGLASSRVYLDDALRPALGPVITYLPLMIAGLVGAEVVVENVFNIPGLGTAIVQSVENRDYPTLQGIVLVLAILVIVLNLLADLIYAALDPRARSGAAAHG